MLLLFLATGLTETLEPARRVHFEWKMLNFLRPVALLLSQRVSACLSGVLFLSLSGQAGAMTIMPFYAERRFGWDTLQVGTWMSLSLFPLLLSVCPQL